MTLPVIETSMLDEYRSSLGSDIINDLIQTYISDAEARSQEMLRFYNEGQIDDLGKEAHALKGAAANLGVQRVAEYTKQLQTACEANDTKAIADLVPKIQAEISLALGELRSML